MSFEITPEIIVYELVKQGKLSIYDAVKFHLKELSFNDIKKIVNDTANNHLRRTT